jgi:hypothetical protein
LLFSLFLFRIFPQNFIRGNAATNHTPTEGEKKIIEEKSRKSKGYNIYRNTDKGLGPKHLSDFLCRNLVRGLTETLTSTATRYQPKHHPRDKDLVRHNNNNNNNNNKFIHAKIQRICTRQQTRFNWKRMQLKKIQLSIIIYVHQIITNKE